MGASARHLLTALDVKGVVLQDKAKLKASGSLWKKAMVTQAKRRWQQKINGGICRRQGRMSIKRRTLLEHSRRSDRGMSRRVKTLKKLIPNGESMGVDGLFRETADYILALEMKVKAMQVMVNMLAGSGS